MTPIVTGEAGSVDPTPIRRRRPWSRLSAGHLLMLIAFVLAALANLIVLRRAQTAHPVAIAGRDLVPGQVVVVTDLHMAELNAGPDLLATFVLDIDSVLGRVVASPVEAGELVRRSDLLEPAAPEGKRAMSIPIDPEHAVGGAIAPGDRVDVIAVTDGSSSYVVAGAEVLAVPTPIGSGLPVDAFYLVVAVDADTALRLAAAISSDHIEVVRSTGAGPPERDSLEIVENP